jgi:hypothetical protein
MGRTLETPKINKPENGFVREVKWAPSDFADHYAYSLTRYNPKTKTWEKISADAEFKKNTLDFDPKWPGGKYRLALKAKGPLRNSSEKSEVEFSVVNGNRSPAAEEVATTRESIERVSGWYSIASYLITMVQYHGINNENNSFLNYSAIGGTGRLGLGYLSPTTPWGFVTIADLSGFTIDGGGNYTFASLEMNGIHRKTLGERGELRQQLGVFYKELPETVGKSSTAITEMNLLKTAGPHYGVEYWYAMTPKLGLQANAHVYGNFIKVKTPSGENIVPTVSAQAGLLGSYRLKRNLTGLIGYAFRHDEVNYLAQVGGKSNAVSGDINRVILEGHYLNLFLEWAL